MQFDLLNSRETLAPLALPLPRGTTRQLISDGPAGTAQTIAQMQKLVNSGKHDNAIRELCGKILNPVDGERPCKSKDYYCYASKLFSWVRDHILYAYDPVQLEYCEDVKKILSNRIADCDSMDILLCAMFEHIGLPSQFVTIKADPSRPNEWTHVYTRVKIPKVGWVCADPIMPEKWFGWEPPYPNGKKYWPASSDAASDPVDTSPSVQVHGPGQAPQPAFDLGISGLGDLSDLGRGGHGRHHGGGRGRGGWGGGWGYGPGWIGFDEPDIYVLPVVVDGRVPTPDLVEVVPEEDTSVQAQENPALEYSVGMGRMNGLFDDALNSIKGTVAVAAARFLTFNEKAVLLTRIINGDLAKEIAQRRAVANKNSDLAQKYLQTAQRSGNSSAISAANDFVDATRKEQYSINDVLTKYNEVSGIIQSASFGKAIPPKVGMNGMGDLITGLVIGLLAIGSVSLAVISMAGALSVWSVSSAYTETARIKAQANAPAGTAPSGTPPNTTPDFFSHPVDYISQTYTKGSETVVKYALIFGGVYLGWQFLKYSTNIAGEKVRSKILKEA